jgi:hypothetical protein
MRRLRDDHAGDGIARGIARSVITPGCCARPVAFFWATIAVRSRDTGMRNAHAKGSSSALRIRTVGDGTSGNRHEGDGSKAQAPSTSSASVHPCRAPSNAVLDRPVGQGTDRSRGPSEIRLSSSSWAAQQCTANLAWRDALLRWGAKPVMCTARRSETCCLFTSPLAVKRRPPKDLQSDR